MAEVERYCSRVVFLHSGRVILDGPPRELARRSGQVVVRFAKEIKRGKRVRVTIPVMFPVTSAAAAQ